MHACHWFVRHERYFVWITALGILVGIVLDSNTVIGIATAILGFIVGHVVPSMRNALTAQQFDARMRAFDEGNAVDDSRRRTPPPSRPLGRLLYYLGS